MRKQLLLGLIFLITIIATSINARADYSNSVVSLSPVAYWPLNETVQPPAPYWAVNSGSLGAAGNGYYETWFAASGNGYVSRMDWTGPVPGATSDGDGAANFTGTNTTYIQIPHTFTNTIIKAPFSVECWVYATNTTDWANIVGAGGQNNRAATAAGAWAGFSLNHYGGSWLFDLYNTNGSNSSLELSATVTVNQWDHLVATYDGTNASLYLNGNLVAFKAANTNALGLGYVPDVVNPILIGRLNVPKYSNTYQGLVDEVAIYPDVLSATDVVNHYAAATAGGYAAAVAVNNPLIYLRLNEPLYTLPASNSFASFPPANNFGSLGSAANGLYQPGTLPGLPGPTGTGFGTANYAVGFNGMNAAVDVGNGALGTVAPTLNVTGTNPLTVVAWFKSNPADSYNRFQGILGHGDSGWRLGFGSSGPAFNPGAGGEISSSDRYNDGRWHMVAGVYGAGSNYLYLDGTLVNKTAFTGSQSGNGRDVLLGGAPDYTAPSGRYWAGSLAQVAFFTNALSATNILQLYNVAGILPFIATQPVSASVNAGASFTNSPIIGGSSLVYRWYQNGAPLTAQTNASLVLNPVLATSGGNYYVVATNTSGAVTSSIVTLTVYTSPQVTQQPTAEYVLFTGGSASFAVIASGAQPLNYFWKSNGAALTAATNSSYMLTNVQVSANYSCVVSNFLGSVTSSVVAVTVFATPAEFYPQFVLVDKPVAFWRLDEPDNGLGNYNAGVVAHDYWGGHNGIYTNAELGQSGYPATPADPDVSAMFGRQVDSDSDVSQISGIDFGITNGGNAALSVEAWVNAPANQSHDGGIITKGTGAGGEQFNLDTGAANYAFRFFVRDAGGGVHLANSSVVPDGNWHHLVGVCDQTNGKVFLYIDGVLNASANITAGSGLLSSVNPVSIGARQGGATGAYDQQYYGNIDEVAIYNYALSAAQVATHYSGIGLAPVILQGPKDATANAGSSATFTVVAQGTKPAYQWFDVTGGFPGTPLTGKTNATLTLSGVTIAQNGNLYAVLITNSYDQVTSAAAQLTVLAGPPVIQTDISPLNVKSLVGVQFSYTLTVSGTVPIHYQWYQDGIPVGLNANAYTVTVLAGTHTYSCYVTNISGAVSSSTATVVSIAVTDSGTNTGSSSTTFAVNFMNAANAVYSTDNGANWTNEVYRGLGAFSDHPANTNWNGFGKFPNGYLPAFDSTTAPQVTSDGIYTPITLNLVYGFDSGSLAYGPGMTGNTGPGEPSFILGNCAVVNGSNPGVGTSANPLGGITLNHVPAGTYNLYLYSANVDNGRGGVFSFTSGGALGGINTVLNDTNGAPASNFVYGVTYVIFTNVAPDASGVISGTWGTVSNPKSGLTGEGNFNGLQLIRLSGPLVVTVPTLAIHAAGNQAIVTWLPAGGTLQYSTNVAGPYYNLDGISSPYTNIVTEKQEFFRVKVP